MNPAGVVLPAHECACCLSRSRSSRWAFLPSYWAIKLVFLNGAIKDFLKNPEDLSFPSLSLPFLSSSPGSLDLARNNRGIFDEDEDRVWDPSSSFSLLARRFFLGVNRAPLGRLEESLALAGVVVIEESVESSRMVRVASERLTLRRSLIGRDRFESPEWLGPEDEAKLTPVGDNVLEVEVLIPPYSQCTAFVVSTKDCRGPAPVVEWARRSKNPEGRLTCSISYSQTPFRIVLHVVPLRADRTSPLAKISKAPAPGDSQTARRPSC